jgi:hypothetical protein
VARAKKIEEERHQIALERIDIESSHTTDQSLARIAALESDLTLQRQQHERTKQLLQKGLVDSSVVVEQQAAIGKVERAIVAEKDELDYQQDSLILKRRELALERETQDAALLDRAASEQVAGSRKPAWQIVAVERDRLAETDVVSSPTEPVRAGDVLGITIHNEPDLPKAFVVQADGTIRFPLVGAIRVLGLTAREVQEALGKQLADRKLAAESAVEVTLRRLKGR